MPFIVLLNDDVLSFSGTREKNGKDASHAQENSSNTETTQGKIVVVFAKNWLVSLLKIYICSSYAKNG